jgi:hypothetical protein
MRRRGLFLAAVVVGGIASADINVISVYEGQAAYALAARQADNPDLDAPAKQHIVDLYLDACSRGLSAEVRDENAVAMGTPVSDIEALLASADELIRMETAAKIGGYLQKASELLPLATDRDVTLCIDVWDPAQIPDQAFVRDTVKGVAGQYLGNNNIWMSIRPFPGWFQQAKYVAPHEYHHLVRDVPETGTLLEEIIDEGLADAFVRQLFDGWTPESFAVTELAREEEHRIWKQMHPYLYSDDEEIVNRFKFGSVYGA